MVDAVMKRLLTAAVCGLISACGQTAQQEDPGPAAVDETPVLFPAVIYTGEDDVGTHFKVTVAVKGASGVMWHSSSEGTIEILTGGDQGATLVARSTGDAMVTASAGGRVSNGAVHSTMYAVADVTAGSGIYRDKGCGTMGCHAGPGSSDITSSGIGKHTDQEIAGAVGAGQNPEGGDIPVGNHKFGLDAASLRQIAAYLRSTEPRGLPIQDD